MVEVVIGGIHSQSCSQKRTMLALAVIPSVAFLFLTGTPLIFPITQNAVYPATTVTWNSFSVLRNACFSSPA